MKHQILPQTETEILGEINVKLDRIAAALESLPYEAQPHAHLMLARIAGDLVANSGYDIQTALNVATELVDRATKVIL